MAFGAPIQLCQEALLPSMCCGGVGFAVVWVCPVGLRPGGPVWEKLLVWRCQGICACVREGDALGGEETCELTWWTVC